MGSPDMRRAIVGLRFRLPSEQVVSQAPVAADRRQRSPELLRPAEVRQGLLRLAADDGNCTHPGLRQRAARIDLISTGEKARGSVGVAKLKRGPASTDKRREILGAGRKRADVARKRGRRRFVVRRIAALRSRGRRGDNHRARARKRSSSQ